VCASHQVLPEYREYERFSTTSVNAFVSPIMDAYIQRVEERIPAEARLRIMQSNGGSISAARARAEAVQTVLSGPSAGVVGAFTAARAAGFERVIAFDMGGTSTDVSLCNGSISTRSNSKISGIPIAIPVVDIHTVGAGGGSIAWLDSAGSLHVGPQSAGADPGPVCYGAGTHLTVTDANLFLGRLLAERFLGGRIRLDLDRDRVVWHATKALPKGSACGIALSNIESYHDAAKRQYRRIQRARRTMMEPDKRRAKQAPRGMFADVHFYLICWTQIHKHLALIRRIEQLRRTTALIDDCKSEFMLRRDFRNHLEHYETRLPGQAAYEKMKGSYFYSCMSDDDFQFGVDRVDVGPKSIRFLNSFMAAFKQAVLFDSLEILERNDPDRLVNHMKGAANGVKADRKIKKLKKLGLL